MKNFVKPILIITLLGLVSTVAFAQTQQGGLTKEDLIRANNPLASVKTVNIHNYVVPYLHGAPDAMMNSLILRYAQPVGRVFLRASMPFMTGSFPGKSPNSGLGDFSVFALYTFPNIGEGIILGAGPMLVMPTGNSMFGAGKWQTGLSVVAFFSKSHVVQFGTLLQWQISFAGTKRDAPNVSLFTPQFFAMWQLGRGTYLRSTGAWSFDFRNGNYNVPLGLGIGKIVKAGKVMFNIFAEPQYSVAARGIGQSGVQIFLGFNTQF